ncbi:MAG: phenylalanine--tRNA ligase subunit alpha [archaeon]|nr:phenylalanine--tRNA ligase subunit alpha [archaeon]
MDIESLIAKLHPLERQVLPVLKENKTLSAICKASKLQEIEVIRSLQWLENKGVLKINTSVTKEVNLDKNGLFYKKEGLPEKIFLGVLDNEFKGLNVITKKSKLSREEVNACIGLLKKRNAIDVTKKEDILHIKITKEGEKILGEKSPEEEFLEMKFPMKLEDIKDQKTFGEFKKRKELIKVDEIKKVSIELTELGLDLSSRDLGGEVVNRLTSGMLKDGSWKDKNFRSYDVEINVPSINRGKKHFVNEAVKYIRSIWLEMGFQEMSGNYVQSAFWDLDALFVPQDHPAREMQDTFYLNGKAELPGLWEKVKDVHETGGDTGSKGWGYKFSEDETRKVLLRTHTTVLSAQTISQLKKEDLPAKFFAIGKVFRNEALDWKHLFEFNQVEGIVIDPNANLKHLKGYLTQFYKKMGFTKVRMRPAHFPYTEPSLEVDVFHPVRKEWIELGGAGIFRPEVVKPLLGFDCPVIAWGQGMGRIISEYWKITDIRDLYKNDLKQIREMKTWLR